MLKRPAIGLLFVFLFLQLSTQLATVATASTSSNFYWKSTYSRGAGTNPSTSATASCAAGLERGSVLTAPFAINGVKRGAYLCYPACKSGYKGTASECWQSTLPAGYVSCGAGLASSETICREIVANQLVSIAALSMAAVSLGTTESSAGEDVADVISVSKTAIQVAEKSPHLFAEAEHISKELLPLAKASALSLKKDMKLVADGLEDAPTFVKKQKAALAAGGISSAKLAKLVSTTKKLLLASKVTLRVGSILYNAVHNQNTSPIDYVRDTTALASFAFALYEITHPGDTVPASTIFGTISAFMYPQYGTTY